MKLPNGRFLDKLLDPVATSLNDDAARRLMRLKTDSATKARVAKLATKCNNGDLTPEERSEYESYVMAGEIIAILRAKAKLHLARREQPV